MLVGSLMEHSNSSSFWGYLYSFNYGMEESTFWVPFSVPQLLSDHRYPMATNILVASTPWVLYKKYLEVYGLDLVF